MEENFKEKYNNLNDLYVILLEGYDRLKYYTKELEKQILYLNKKYNINATNVHNIDLKNIYYDAMMFRDKDIYLQKKKEDEKNELINKIKTDTKEVKND